MAALVNLQDAIALNQFLHNKYGTDGNPIFPTQPFEPSDLVALISILSDASKVTLHFIANIWIPKFAAAGAMIPAAAAVANAAVAPIEVLKIPKSLTQALIKRIVSSHLYPLPQVLDQATMRHLSLQYKFDEQQSERFNAAFDAMDPLYAALKELLLKNVNVNIVSPIKQYFTTNSRTDVEAGDHRRVLQLKKSRTDAAKLAASEINAANVALAAEASVQATNNITRTTDQIVTIKRYIDILFTDSNLLPTPSSQQEINDGVILLEDSVLLFNTNVMSSTDETADAQIQLKAGITELCKILSHVQMSELVNNFLRQDNASSDAPPTGDTLHTGSSSLPKRQCGGRFGEKKRTNVDRKEEISTNDAANIWCTKATVFRKLV
jgi:hypothetical protein